MKKLKNIIENTFEEYSHKNTIQINLNTKNYIYQVIELLNSGKIRVSEKIDRKWITHTWIKKAILLFFCIKKNKILNFSEINFFDKVPLKFSNYDKNQFEKSKIRLVPPAFVRYGAFIGSNTVIMPSYINIGAYVGKNTMIDTWATVGSCAQIGKNVHLSGGVGIGGVLEPLQLNPTIIEDNCFIGARSEIVEGVIVKKNSVISMGVYIGSSTKIYDRENDKVYYGYIPSGSVVVPGTLPSKNGKYNLYCVVIVKKVDSKTRSKVGINELLRTEKID